MITLYEYKTIDGIDLYKLKLFKYTFEVDGHLTMWFIEGYVTGSSNSTFKTIDNSMYNPPPAFTIDLSQEQKILFLSSSESIINNKFNIQDLENFLVNQELIKGSVDD
tara:strand:+ start:1780 stop:2103 length:324 start_codon:yes stop_codon:yes gene_type:complete